MSTFFEGSVVLTQDSVGVSYLCNIFALIQLTLNPRSDSQHASVSAPSVCTQKYIREYFVRGSLPPADTICHPDALPFPPAGSGEATSEQQTTLGTSFSSVERDIFAAVHAMSMDRRGPVSNPLWAI